MKFTMPTRRRLLDRSIMLLSFLVVSPFIIAIMTMFSPSVSEATNPALGECDVYYGEVYYPCTSLKDAVYINAAIILVVVIILYVFSLFLDDEELK